ncbi:MAG TPA: CHRD domain-containing protein [Stellaceae bacterium]|nr:CHRD domain-containing protein [Stellaceae bacterium]
MRQLTRRGFEVAVFAGSLVLAGCAGSMSDSSKAHFTATLNGAAEVPAKAVPGTGSADVWLDKNSKTLTWTVAYGGLTGDAKAAHFHGPAAAGANAGVLVPITISPSPMKGSAQLTDAQIADLSTGKWYINIHTAANPPGEIRGQVIAAP